MPVFVVLHKSGAPGTYDHPHVDNFALFFGFLSVIIEA